MGNFRLETMHCWYLFLHNWERFPWDGSFLSRHVKSPNMINFGVIALLFAQLHSLKDVLTIGLKSDKESLPQFET